MIGEQIVEKFHRDILARKSPEYFTSPSLGKSEESLKPSEPVFK